MANNESDTQKSVVALLATLFPLYFLQTKSQLNTLHLGLLQVLLLILVRAALNVDYKSRLSTGRKAIEPPQPNPHDASPPRDTTTRLSSKPKQHKAPVESSAPTSNPLYPVELLDATLRSFVDITFPEYTALIAPTPPSLADAKAPTTAGLSQWTSLYSADDIEVLEHPSTRALYAIKVSFPDVPVRNLVDLLVNVESRSTWDGMTKAAEALDDVLVEGRKASVGWLGMKGMALIKPKDMCLLSVIARLPSSDTGERIICASKSFKHPACPIKGDYNRMQIGISGFIVEQDGEGSRIVQITDLTGLGSWVPSAVFRTVTQTLIPKSLRKLGRAALARDILDSRSTAGSWPPPLLGSFGSEVATVPSTKGKEKASLRIVPKGGTVEAEARPASSAKAAVKDVNALVGQLRVLSSRLHALEEQKAAPPEMSFGTRAGLVGGAVAAAAAVAILGIWNRRRK